MKYQYFTVSKKEGNINYTSGTVSDSIKLQYNFNTKNEGIELLIRNESNQPIYVNWQRSALIIENEAVSYWTNKASVSLNENGSDFQLSKNLSDYSSTIDGVIIGSEAINFIPPNSVLKRIQLTPGITEINIESLIDDATIQITRIPIKIIKYNYTIENSPLHFRSYITLSTNSNFNSEIIVEDSFWISDVTKTSLPPKQYIGSINNPNVLYKSEVTGAGAVLGTACILGLAMTYGVFLLSE